MQPSSNGPWSSPGDRSPFHVPQEDFFSTPQSYSTSSRSQNQRFSASYDQNLIANATHEQLWANSVYLQLWHSNTVLKAKYDTLQTNYSTLATSVPQVFSVIPNPYSVAVPASIFSTTAQVLIPSTKPEKIKYWRRSDYNVRKATRGDLTVSNDESGTDSDEEMPKKKKKAKTENVLGFLENEDGTPFNDDCISFVRSTAYKAFNSLLNAGLAPANWRDCSLEITNRFRREMIQATPALALGENYWKVDAVGTEVYAQWKRKHLPSAARGNTKGEEDELSSQDTSKLKAKKVKAQGRGALEKGKGKEVTSEKRRRAYDDHSGHKRRRVEESADRAPLEESADRAPLDMEVISLDDARSPSPPPVEKHTYDDCSGHKHCHIEESADSTPLDMQIISIEDAHSPSPHPVDMPQEMDEPVLPTPPPDIPMPDFIEPTPEPEREKMVELKNPLSRFYVEPLLKSVLPPTRTLPVASTSDSDSMPTPTANAIASSSKDASSKSKDISGKSTPTTNAVTSTAKDASSKPKGATYFIPAATLTGYNLFGKSFTDDGKKKFTREQVKAEYQKPENKQHWDKIAKERKAEKNKMEAAAAPAESQQA